MTIEAAPSRATSLDVARLAGVSRSTVSQVLNGNHDRFPLETRTRVEAAAAELGYRPSRAGRALVTGVSDVIVVAVPNVTFGRHLQDAVDRIAKLTAARGMSVVVRYAGDDPEATLTAVLDLRPVAVVDLGVFLSPDDRRAIASSGTRIVPDLSVLDEINENPNHLIGRLQARHLLERPGRRLVIALLGDDRVDAYGPDRHQGVLDEARAAGQSDVPMITVPLEREAARDALAAVVANNPDAVLGVCCYNDDVAIAVLSAARDLGLSVPDRIAVVGVDRTAVGQLVDPPLSSISIDLPGMLTVLLGELDFLRDSSAPEGGLDLSNHVELVPGGTS
jgi:DNA-binding LacI/PurR family transcriptional regulator